MTIKYVTFHGFTLVELMIEVAIIGILAVIGIPQYQNYTARAQATEGLTLENGLKTTLAEYYSVHGSFPDDGVAIRTPQSVPSPQTISLATTSRMWPHPMMTSGPSPQPSIRGIMTASSFS